MDDLVLAQRLLRDDVVDRVLKRDMTSLYNVGNVLELERLFIYLCLNSGGLVVQDKLPKDSGLYQYATQSSPTAGLVITKAAADFGPVGSAQDGFRPFAVPAFVFLYLLGQAEHQGYVSRPA